MFSPVNDTGVLTLWLSIPSIIALSVYTVSTRIGTYSWTTQLFDHKVIAVCTLLIFLSNLLRTQFFPPT